MSKLLIKSIPLVLFLFSLFLHGTFAEVKENNPFTPKASLIRYWNTHISNNLPKPNFLISKASPLNAVDTAIFTKLAAKHALNTRTTSFCTSANLFCGFDDENNDSSLEPQSHGKKKPPPTPPHKADSNFASYNNKQFTTYGGSHAGGGSSGGVDSFKNYSLNVNMPVNAFTRYSPKTVGHGETFANYGSNGNVANDTFSSYAAGGATGGLGEFKSYESNVNVPNLKFTSYSANGNNHKQSFGSYAEDTNSGSQSFTTYGKNGKGVPTGFNNYGSSSNIVASTFASYGQLANAANDSFKGYSSSANNPHNVFKNYGSKGKSGSETFVNYRDNANVGDDTFQNYLRGSTSTKASFVNYGKSFNVGIDKFKGYGKQAVDRKIEFKGYGVNNSFSGYADKKGVSFSGYTQKSPMGDSLVNKWVEEGKFFRESMLKPGTVMKMPDIKDKMPKRSFLPRVISSKLPFSSSKLAELREIFKAKENSTLELVITNALGECERPPSPNETKRCVASVEDMIDFSVSVLGDNVVVRTTENVDGSGKQVMIGSVKGINGGKVTKAVSCHQSLLPYLLYYCHSVPNVRVYEADILDLETKAKINHGVAICHLDTSAWSAGHGAFLALGSGPGLIEVCHWIFENDMNWTVAD